MACWHQGAQYTAELAREGDGGKAYKLLPSDLVKAIPTHLFFWDSSFSKPQKIGILPSASVGTGQIDALADAEDSACTGHTLVLIGQTDTRNAQLHDREACLLATLLGNNTAMATRFRTGEF